MSETEIRRLMKQLGESINETLADSPKINESIKDIRNSGYEIFLIIEAKISVSPAALAGGEATVSKESVHLRITPDDAKFLKSLMISVE
jgi:hypothetical protein